MFDRTDVLWREEPTPEPAHTPARDDAPTDDQARQVTRRPGAPGHPPAAPIRTRTITTPLTVRTGRTARQNRPTATDRRASSIEDGRAERPAKAGREPTHQRTAPRRTPDAMTPPRTPHATSKAAPHIEPGSTRRTWRARHAPPRNATSSPPSGRPASARPAPGWTPPPAHHARPRPCPTTATRTDRRAPTSAHGQTRTGAVFNA